MRLRECTPLKLTTLYLDTRTLAENAGKVIGQKNLKPTAH
jgi:hypothetical protein